MDGGDEVHHSGGFLGGADLLARTGLDSPHIDDVRTLRDDLVDSLKGRIPGVGGALVIERVGGAVDNRHDGSKRSRHGP